MSRHYDNFDDGRGPRNSSHGRHRSRDSSEDDYYNSAAPYMTPAEGSGTSYEQRASNPDFDRNVALQVPPTHNRPRSLPPASSHPMTSRHSDSRSPSPEYERGSGPRDPVGKTKHALDKAFSTSASGIGVGVIGAIVGGLAAREASEAAARSRNRQGHHNNPDNDRTTLISTIVGAAIGGLGANAIEKRVESRHHRHSHGRHGEPRSRDGNGQRDSDSDSDSDQDDSGRGRHRHNNRGLVLSRSPSPSSNRSRSRSHHSHHSSRSIDRQQLHAGTADDYFDTVRGHGDGYERTASRRSEVDYR